MSVMLLTERNLEFLSFTGSFTGSPESTLVNMPHCWKSYALDHIILLTFHGFLYIFMVFYIYFHGFLYIFIFFYIFLWFSIYFHGFLYIFRQRQG